MYMLSSSTAGDRDSLCFRCAFVFEMLTDKLKSNKTKDVISKYWAGKNKWSKLKFSFFPIH